MSISIKHLKQLSLDSLDNCQNLMKEATLLHENKHFARSIFLIMTAQEELGKHIMCGAALTHTREGKFDAKKFMKRFSSHSEKHLNYQMWRSTMTTEFDKVEEDNFKKYSEALKRRAYLAKLTRDRCLYTSFEQGKIMKPAEFDGDEELSKLALVDMRDLLKYLDHHPFVETIKNFESSSSE